MEMTVTEGLVQLKLLDKRIDSVTSSSRLVWATACKGSDTMINGMSRETVEKNIKSNYDSICDLIKRRAAIKSAIVKSNAVTNVTIAGETMTVAEAIERKSSIEYEEDLMESIHRSLMSATQLMNQKNDIVEENLKSILEKLVSSDKPNMAKEQTELADAYRTQNKWELVDPLKAEDVVSFMKEKIDSFMANVDTALSLSNAVTTIEV